MLFNSLSFLFFFPIVFLIFHFSRSLTFKKRFLLLASYFFYSCWDYRFTFLLLFSTSVDFFVAKWLTNPSFSERQKSHIFKISVISNLGFLGVFKYFNFFSESLASLLSTVGMTASFPTLNIVLPVGISFYVFQSFAYVIDVRRKEMAPIQNFYDFSLYVSYFPQLVAGPIERASQLAPQLFNPRPLTKVLMVQGIGLMLIGYFKKVVLGDSIAPMVDDIFERWTTLPSIRIFEGIFLFSLQIYCDFSGYTDIARGVSKWFGVELMLNFKQPYFSRNITEFWRRWHISLSFWLRDYLYISIGGNRKGTFRTYLNLFVTMLLGGLWHGASLTFVVWGALHGLYLAIHKKILSYQPNGSPPKNKFSSIVGTAATFFLVTFTWVFFRAPQVGTALGMLKKAFSFEGPFLWSSFFLMGFFYLTLLFVDYPLLRTSDDAFWSKWKGPSKIAYMFILLVLIVFWGLKEGTSARPFIYFQF